MSISGMFIFVIEKCTAPKLTPCMCVQYIEGCSVHPVGVQYIEGYHEYIRGIT